MFFSVTLLALCAAALAAAPPPRRSPTAAAPANAVHIPLIPKEGKRQLVHLPHALMQEMLVRVAARLARGSPCADAAGAWHVAGCGPNARQGHAGAGHHAHDSGARGRSCA